MTIQSRLQDWLKAKNVDTSLEQAEQVAAEAQDFCYTCARANELKRVILTAAYQHLKRKQQREGIMGKIVLVTSDKCPPCDEVVEVLKPLIDKGEIEVVDYATCEDCDREAITKAGISTFPSMAIRSEDEGLMVSPLSLAPKEEKAKEAKEDEELRVQPSVAPGVKPRVKLEKFEVEERPISRAEFMERLRGRLEETEEEEIEEE